MTRRVAAGIAAEPAQLEQPSVPEHGRSGIIADRDPMRDGFMLAASIWLLMIAFGVVPPGVDATQYYLHRLPNPYDVVSYGESLGGFWYPPPVAQVLYPLTLLPLSVFSAVMTGAGFVALYAVLGRWAWAGLFFPPVWWDLSAGNVNTAIGAAALLSARAPLLALLPAFTKPTSAIIVLWHVVRRDWPTVRTLVVVGGGITLVSFALGPSLWFAWWDRMIANAGYLGPGYFTVPVPLWPRLVAAVALVVWGARTNRRWTLPVAAWLAIPVLWWTTMAALVAIAGARRLPSSTR